MQTLFVMATASDWAEIMYLMASSRSIGQTHIYMANTFWVFFSIFFMIVASMFLLNLFVGVIISTFNSEQDKIGGNNLLTPKQKEWIDLKLLVLRSSPIAKLTAPKNLFRRVFFKLADNVVFEYFILLTILANTIVLALKWY